MDWQSLNEKTPAALRTNLFQVFKTMADVQKRNARAHLQKAPAQWLSGGLENPRRAVNKGAVARDSFNANQRVFMFAYTRAVLFTIRAEAVYSSKRRVHEIF